MTGFPDGRGGLISRFLFLMFVCLPLWASDQEHVEMLVIEQGIATEARQMLQDSRGYMWVAASNGLFRYNGIEFEPFKYKAGDYRGLNGDAVYRLALGPNGDVWVATNNGVNRYRYEWGFFERFDSIEDDEDSLPSGYVFDIKFDKDGFLWVCGKGGLSRLNPETHEVKRFNFTASGAPLPGVNSLHKDDDGALWAGSNLGLYRFSDGEWTQMPTVPNEAVKILTRVDEFRLLITVGKELYFFHTRFGGIIQNAPSPHDKEWSTLDPTAAMVDQSGRLWIGTFEQGVFRFNPENRAWDHFDSEGSDSRRISVGLVHHILQDASGLVWVSTSSSINKIRHSANNFHLHTHLRKDTESLLGKRVKAVLVDSRNNLWVGGENGLNLMEPGTRGFRHFTAQDGRGLRHNTILALAEDVAGFVWVLTEKGLLHRYDPRKDRFRLHMFSMSIKGQHTMVSDRKGGLWIGGEGKGGGLMYVHARRRTTKIWRQEENDPEGLTSNNIIRLFMDSKDRLWVNMGGDLKYLDPKTQKFHEVDLDYHLEDGFDYLSGFAEDSKGRIWMSGEKGLHVWLPEDEEIISLDDSDGLPVTSINGLVCDERDNLWLTHKRGLSRYRPEDKECVNFNLDDGLNNVFVWGVNARSDSGELFFGGWNGVTHFDPSTIQNDSYVPPVRITQVKWMGPDILDSGNDKPVELEAHENAVKFFFAAMDFATPHKNLYSYKLDGYEHKWSVPDTNPWVGYSMLKPGNYRFRVKGSNGNGKWTESEESIRFTIKPPFWRTPLAFALYAVLGPGFLLGSHRLRVKQLKRREQALKKVVEEKTASLRAEKEKTEAQARKLLELDRLKTQFFSNVSHEFRTPLTLIIGPLEREISQCEDSQKNRHFQVMLRNARRLLRLINQLLDISKLEAGKMRLLARPAPISKLLKPIVSAFHSLADSNRINLTLSGSGLKQRVYLDPEKMEKVMFNLLGNAFQFTSAGGEISVEVEADDQQVQIRVRDTGVGIPAQSLPYIFDRFHQADASSTRDKEGTGIGLSLVKELVELHRGTISAESVAGEGACFTVSLPLGSDHLAPHELADQVLDADQFHAGLAAVEMAHLEKGVALSGKTNMDPMGETLLIVDDHPDIRDYIRSALSDQYRILEAVDGLHGLETAQRSKPDLIISDVMMPNMDGYDMCRALRKDKKLAHIPIIMLTAKASDEMKVEGLEIGANDYLSKPFNVRELAARVRNLLNIREQERAMKKSLEMAHKAQVCMLPGSIPKVEGLDIASFCQPAREVGGDYYDFITRDDHSLGIVVGDVSGKGMSAALYMTMTKGLVQAYCGSNSPKDTLSLINRQFHQASASNIFISLQYAVIDTRKEEMILSNAGHNPLILHSPSRGFTRFLKTGGMAIGLENGTVFDQVVQDASFSILKGDTLVFYTDGITEGMNEKQEVFGEERLLDLIKSSNGQSAKALLSVIKSELSLFVGDTDQTDDMTAVVVKIPELANA